MKNLFFALFFVFLTGQTGCWGQSPADKPISLNPQNPNYFLFRGKPTILITSGEHYGAVMNVAFDYEKYLNTLKAEGFNYTRIFIGPYCEIGDNLFGITNNTMNPKPENWLNPWLKAPSSNKYDLTKWNEKFFSRLKSVVSKAAENGIVVEITLFTSYYSNHQWSFSPFNPENNIQNFAVSSYHQVNTVNNGELMYIQEQYVRKVVHELNPFGNFFFEIQNEPWSDNSRLVGKIQGTDTTIHQEDWQKNVEIAKQESLDWQRKLSEIIRKEESSLPVEHLIAQNICNRGYKIEDPDPNISIFNFHYAYPMAAADNLHLNRAIALDETGFMPHRDYYYRSQAWKFLLAGGALYNNLDYSFTVGHEDGTSAIDDKTPGWGGVAFRKQIKVLKDFMGSLDFLKMKPDNSVLKVESGNLTAFQVLAEAGKCYAIYLDKGSRAGIALDVPNGKYAATWIDPKSGSVIKTENLVAENHLARIICPEFQKDIALKISYLNP